MPDKIVAEYDEEVTIAKDFFLDPLHATLAKYGLKAEFIPSQAPAERLKNLADCRVLIPSSAVTREVLDSCRILGMIQVWGIGVDGIDLKATGERGIYVCNTGETVAETVAQHSWAFILCLSKRVMQGHMSIVKGNHFSLGKSSRQVWRQPRVGIELWGKTLGLIGLGAIGKRVARVGHAFNMKMLAYDPYVTKDVAQLYAAELVDLKTLLKESDVVSISVPLNEETRGLIGRMELALMKPSAFIVNTSRGPIIDEKALIESLKNNRIGGAGLDVFEKEPLPMESPLRTLDNVVLTPHFGGGSLDGGIHLAEAVASNISKFLKGEKPMWIKNGPYLIKK